MSGGPKAPTVLDFLRQVRSVVDAGGRGVVVGRNVFQHPNPRGVVRAVMAVVHEGAAPEEAVRLVDQG
jgi:DhnA-type fructose-1,6-bisphosphate aldolase and related enzymes